MEKTNITEIITKYFKAVCDAYSLGNVESSYNAPIMALFTDIGCAARDLSGERKGQSGENIDIKLWHTEEEVTETEPFAGVEVKKVGGIDKRALSQIKIEADRYGNAILTDNIEWRFWRAGDTEMYTGLRIMELVDGKLVLREDNIELFFSLLEDFLLRDPAQIKSSTKLAEYMAMHARTIRSIISGILKDDGNGQPLLTDNQKKLPMFMELYGLYRRIKSDLRPLMNTREFADMYAQTIVYGLFIARYNDTTPDSFDRYEAIKYLQEESELLKQFFLHIAGSGRKHPTLEGVIDKLGKTETAKYIAEKLNERLFRKQFSMLHSEEFTSYLFGGKHNQNSFAKELLERESNVILLDEFDKPNPVFYSAFYQLFDEGVFADKNYTVTMKNAIIICTSNFLSEEQIRERLGDPIYSRFDAVIHFTDLQPEAVQKLLDREIDRQYSKLDEEERAIIDSRKIVSLLKTNSYCLSNARQIKKFVREAFSATITDEVL